jgi:predicted MFS family arabinose efflux permease
VLAHNILYTYIAPLLEPAGIQADIDRVLLVFGLTALLSHLAGGPADRSMAALAGATQLHAVWPFGAGVGVLDRLAGDHLHRRRGLGGWHSVGLPALLQTALAKSAGESADAAQSMLVTVWNLGIAGGGLAAGCCCRAVGVLAFPWAVVALMLLALCKRP